MTCNGTGGKMQTSENPKKRFTLFQLTIPLLHPNKVNGLKIKIGYIIMWPVGMKGKPDTREALLSPRMEEYPSG